MKDAIGNKIQEGSLLYWKSKDMTVKAAMVSDGGLSVGSTSETTPPVLVLQIAIPTRVERGVKEAFLGDFLCLVNPQATEEIERMLT